MINIGFYNHMLSYMLAWFLTCILFFWKALGIDCYHLLVTFSMFSIYQHIYFSQQSYKICIKISSFYEKKCIQNARNTQDSWLECGEVGFTSGLPTSTLCFWTLVTNKTDEWSEMLLNKNSRSAFQLWPSVLLLYTQMNSTVIYLISYRFLFVMSYLAAFFPDCISLLPNCSLP